MHFEQQQHKESTEHHGFVDKMKGGFSSITSKLSEKIHDLKERVKPSEHNELGVEEVHTDQMSTLHTLSMESVEGHHPQFIVRDNFPPLADSDLMQPEQFMTHVKGSYHLSPKAPKSSSGLLARGLVKASDVIAEGVGTIMNMVLPEEAQESSNEEKMKQIGEKVDEKKQEIKEGVQELPQKASEKVGEIKEKAGEKTEELRQSAQETKEQASQKLEQGKEQLKSQGQELKGQMMKEGELSEEEEVNPEHDLDESSKKQVKKINEEMTHRPHMQERVIMTHGKGKPEQQKGAQQGESAQKDLKSMGQDLSSKASEKVEEWKEKASEKVQDWKQSAEQTSKEASGKIEQGKESMKGKAEEGQVSEEVSRKIHELADKFGPGESAQGQEGQEHHEYQLSKKSPSFRPSDESKLIAEKVFEGLEENDRKLTEKIEEAEHILEMERKEHEKLSPKQKGFRSRGKRSKERMEQKSEQYHLQKDIPKQEKGKGEPQFEKAEDVEKMLEKENKLHESPSGKKSKSKGQASGKKKKSPQQYEQGGRREQRSEGERRPHGRRSQEKVPEQRQGSAKKKPYFGRGYEERIEYVPKYPQEQEHKEPSKQSEQGERREHRFEGGNRPQKRRGSYEERIEYVPKEQHKPQEQASKQKESPKQEFGQQKEQQEKIQPQEQEKTTKGSVPLEQQEDKPQKSEIFVGKDSLEKIKPYPKEETRPGPVEEKYQKNLPSQKEVQERRGEKEKSSESQSQEERVPLVDKLAQNISKKIEGIKEVFKIDESQSQLEGQREQPKEFSQEKQQEQGQRQEKKLESKEEISQPQKGEEGKQKAPIFDKLSQGYQDLTMKFYETAGNMILQEKKMKEEVEKNLQNLKGKFSHHSKEEKESSKPEKEQFSEPSKPLRQEASESMQSAQQKLSQVSENLQEKLSSKKEEASEASRSLKQGAQQSVQSAKQQFAEGSENLQEKFGSKKEEAAETSRSLKQGAQQSVQSAIQQFVEGSENIQEKLGSKKEEAAESGQSLKGRIQEGFHEITEKISEVPEHLKNQLHKKKENIYETGYSFSQRIQAAVHDQDKEAAEENLGFKESEPKESKEGEKGERFAKLETIENRTQGGLVEEAPTQKIKPNELKDFKEVKEGFTESVSEFKHEKRIEEIGQEKIASTNPFEPLISAKPELVQPLYNWEVVGGNLEEMTSGETGRIGQDITNIQEESSEGEKSLKERVKEGFGSFESGLSGKLSEAKEKVMSTFSSKDKENVPSNE